MTRESFLNRVREAASRGKAYSVQTKVQAERPGCYSTEQDLITTFASAAQAAGGEVTVCADKDAVAQQIVNSVQPDASGSAFHWEHPLLEELELEKLLHANNAQSISNKSLQELDFNKQRRKILTADIGITSCQFAIAETGSLVLCSKKGQERLASLAPPIHLAIVAESQIRLDLYDLFDHYQTEGNQLPTNLVINTGPSKTGDIEMKLTTGIHGPKQWKIIIWQGR